ncbi:MAG: hypothetical protein H6822_20400 [Planctomycetaceae bacterium]|nr:hypothetical protein [Planctomycetales bacterium]MCB9924551.1 hypothetical protein [Planctomycetaceae bacterium]
MAEEVKRLEPKLEVVKELFVKSGNECAFPGCTHRIIDSDGVVIGQICHIEAAEKGGQRFNAKMSNEDRRQFSNLMLMCHAHHKVTDDVTKYSVLGLQKMKREHEAKYTLAPEKLLKAIVDEAKHTVATPARSLKRLDKEMGWNYDDYQFDPVLTDLAELLGRLQQVPARSRQLLVVIVERVGKAGTLSGSSTVPLAEIQTACGLESQDLADQLRILTRYGIARYDRSAADFSQEIQLHTLNGPWDFWTDLKKYCKATGHSLDEFIIGLRFDLLD